MADKRCRIVPSNIGDVYALAANLRDADAEEVTCLGIEVRHALRMNYRDAILRRTAFVDGRIAAMWGVCGDMLGDIGSPYLMTTPLVEKVPVTMLKEARKGIAEMLVIKKLLTGHVAASYVRACRFLEILGFTLFDPEPLGPKQALFRKFEMRR